MPPSKTPAPASGPTFPPHEQHPTAMRPDAPAPLQRPAELLAPMETLAWGMFWRFVFSNAGAIFFFAGVLCFFAYNWASMPAFAKFGLIAALMAAASALPLARGLYSLAGGLGLLLCGLIAGPLMAVYGQTYQTGADAWELFRAWALFLLPLACMGRQTALWFFCWLTSSLWAVLWIMQGAFVDAFLWKGDFAFLFIYGQLAFLLLWEAVAHVASRSAAGARLEFLQTRWFPRLVAAIIIYMFSHNMIMFISHSYSDSRLPPVFTAVYLATLLCGAWWYTRKPDPLMIAWGLCGIIVLLLTATLQMPDIISIGGLLIVTLILLGSGGIAGKILMACHTKAKEAAGASKTSSGFPALRQLHFPLLGETTATVGPVSLTPPPPSPPWYARLLMATVAWVATPLVLALIYSTLESVMRRGVAFSICSLLIMGLGAAFSRSTGPFISQVALCLSLAGTLGLGISMTESLGLRYTLAAPFLSSLFLGFWVVKNTTYRFLAVSIGTVLLCYGLFTPLLSAWEDVSPSPHEASYAPLLLPLAFLTGLALVPVFCRRAHQAGGRRADLLSPVYSGVIAALLVMAAAHFFIGALHMREAQPLFASLRVTGISCGIALMFLSLRIARELRLRPHLRFGLTALAAVLAALSWWQPWLGAGFLCLTLARADKNIPLMGLCAAYFTVCVNLAYYNLQTSLLDTSFSLLELGALLLAAAFLLHRAMEKTASAGVAPAFAEGLPSEPSPQESTRASSSSFASSPAQSRYATPVVYRIVLACVLAVFFLAFGWAVRQKEDLLASGTRMVLPLRPLDPRSLMQGDYMTLSFSLERDIQGVLKTNERHTAGAVVVTLTHEEEARLKRLDAGEKLAPDERRLRFRVRNGSARVSSGAFFFQEGHGVAYERAKFAELRVAEDGTALITRLLDEEKQRIVPGEEKKARAE